jgi:hypothetical protein
MRDTHRITDWRNLAWMLYRKMYGRRCVECSKPVEPEEAAMFTMEGLDEIILIHERCHESSKQTAVLETPTESN